jgi:hypothetical protein
VVFDLLELCFNQLALVSYEEMCILYVAYGQILPFLHEISLFRLVEVISPRCVLYQKSGKSETFRFVNQIHNAPC